MGHPSNRGYITLPDGTDGVNRANYTTNLNEIDNALYGIEQSVLTCQPKLQYYVVQCVQGYNNPLAAAWEAHPELIRTIGTIITWQGEIMFATVGKSATYKITIPMRNTGDDATITLRVPRTTDNMCYQIDNNTRVQLFSGEMSNGTCEITIPGGDHTLAFFLMANNQYSTGLNIDSWWTTEVYGAV